MNLIIDIGNSSTKYAIFGDNNLIVTERVAAFSVDVAHEILNKYSVERSIVSAVGRIDEEAFEVLSKKIPVLYFSSSTPIPIKNCYATPSTLGADRLAAAVGANELFPNNNVLSIDCGTAITYDLVNRKGEYVGGAISPGITTRFRALHHFTAKLPEVPFNEEFPLVGATTHESILAGVLNGVVNEVDGYIASLKEKYIDLLVLFTGGDAFFFEKKLKNSIFVHPNLVILGLNRILNYNAKH